MSTFTRAVPVLQVRDVERSIEWYEDVFHFVADPFPDKPPFGFAMLTRDDAEVMLQCAEAGAAPPASEGWTVYLRTSGEDFLQMAKSVARAAPLLRGPERMFYGLVEFEVADPDGYRVCVSGEVPLAVAVPAAAERK